MNARKAERAAGPFQLSVGQWSVKGWIVGGERGVTLYDGAHPVREFTPAEASALGIAIQAVAACAEHAQVSG